MFLLLNDNILQYYSNMQHDYSIRLQQPKIQYTDVNWGEPYSEPYHVGSTVKSVFLLVCLIPYRIWLKTLSANQHYYIKYMES